MPNSIKINGECRQLEIYSWLTPILKFTTKELFVYVLEHLETKGDDGSGTQLSLRICTTGKKKLGGSVYFELPKTAAQRVEGIAGGISRTNNAPIAQQLYLVDGEQAFLPILQLRLPGGDHFLPGDFSSHFLRQAPLVHFFEHTLHRIVHLQAKRILLVLIP